MKKLPQSFRKNLYFSKIYQEEIFAIRDVLAEEAAPMPAPVPAPEGATEEDWRMRMREEAELRERDARRVKIQIPGMELESLDQLRDLADEAGQLSLSIDKPRITLEISRWGVTVFASEETSAAQGMAQRIEGILSRAEPRGLIGWLRRLPSWPMFFAPLLAFNGGFGHPWLVYLAWTIVALNVLSIRLPTMSTKPRPTRTFWSRNRDKLAIALVSAVAGGLVVYLARLAPLPQVQARRPAATIAAASH